MDLNVIIVAGGIGSRMKTETPKQFLTILGKPILLHTIKKFYHFKSDVKIIVVLPKQFISQWSFLCKKHNCKIDHTVVEGGKARFFSVKNGLSHINNDGLVMVHDGVRPLVNNDTIQNVIVIARKKGNGIPVININESIREINSIDTVPVDRQNYRLVQTPQCFRTELLKKAYDQDFRESFTDDATVVESLGEKINLVEGNFENIKITRPIDLKFAEAYIRIKNPLI